jgi:hypothetical protein
MQSNAILLTSDFWPLFSYLCSPVSNRSIPRDRFVKKADLGAAISQGPGL